MSEGDDLLAVADAALAKAKRAADEAEVLVRHDESAAAIIRGQLSNGRSASRTLVGVRVRIGRRLGTASAALADSTVIDRAIDEACRAAQSGVELPSIAPFAAGERIVTRAFQRAGPPEGTADARERAMALAERVRPAAEYFTISTGGARMRLVIATTSGTLAADALEGAGASIEARVNERLPRAVTGHRAGRAAADCEDFADELVRDLRAAQHVGALASGRETVILDAHTAGTLIPSIMLHLSAATMRHGISRFSGKLGERVLSPTVTIHDAADGTRVGGRDRAVDDEGVRTRARALVERGVLRDLVYNAEEARAAGRADAAGNGYRGGDVVAAPPKPAASLFALEPGRRRLDEIVASSRRAILVKHELLGWYHSTGVNGLLSVVAPCAFLVEEGRIVSGLPPVTLGFDVLAALADERVEIGADEALTGQGACAPIVLPDVAVST